MQADILQLKESNRWLKEEYSKDLKLVKDEIKSTKSELKSILETSRKNSNSINEIRQSLDRLNDEKSNGVANLRSDIKQIRSDIRVSDDTNALEFMSVKDKIADIYKLNKRLSKLENKIKDGKSFKSCMNSVGKGEVLRDSDQ